MVNVWFENEEKKSIKKYGVCMCGWSVWAHIQRIQPGDGC